MNNETNGWGHLKIYHHQRKPVILRFSPVEMNSRNWCFTINNPEPINLEERHWGNNLKLLVAIPEIGESGTLHFQGYLELKNTRALSWIKKRLPRAHLERRKGSANQALLYCLKTVKDSLTLPEEVEALIHQESETFGTRLGVTLYRWNEDSQTSNCTLEELITSLTLSSKKGPTQKETLLKIKEEIKNGADDSVIANKYFDVWCKNFRAIERYRALITPPRDHPVEVIVIQGPTGTGKSKFCKDEFPGAYWKQRSQWWDNYAGHDTVIIDEFYGWLPFDLLLRVCDRYPLLVETKGGQVQFVAKKIVITTNSVPNTWYKNVYFESFVRRVNEWMVFPVWGQRQSFILWSEAVKAFVDNL